MSIWRRLFRWSGGFGDMDAEAKQAEAETVAAEQLAKLEHTQKVVVPSYARLTDRLGAEVERALRRGR